MAKFFLVLYLYLSLSISYVASFFASHVSRRDRKQLVRFADNESSPQESGSDDDAELSMQAFLIAKEQLQVQKEDEVVDFDGYAMRDVILAKWGACFDVDFNRVETFGFRSVYLNILPFKLGRRPFRHESELDYLCHLQAVVEILQKYDQLDFVLYQISETSKKPRPGTSPLIAVPLRLDLSSSQVDEIFGN
jgi:hypothetical protein